ncbi:MAG: hypothetical protein IIC02_00405 [Planctomycetes bacterium]|nr:hypothetical protein [Planctomycetota bacterium]
MSQSFVSGFGHHFAATQGSHRPVDYLHGAKLHEPPSYELTGSGVPRATLHDFDP